MILADQILPNLKVKSKGPYIDLITKFSQHPTHPGEYFLEDQGLQNLEQFCKIS